MDKQELSKICKEIEELLNKKNKTSGDGNIIEIGQEGVIIRIKEKIERLKNMLANKIDDEESLEDTWNDTLAGKFALMMPVMTSTEGLWVAIIRCMPAALAICASRAIYSSTSFAATIIRSASSSMTRMI